MNTDLTYDPTLFPTLFDQARATINVLTPDKLHTLQSARATNANRRVPRTTLLRETRDQRQRDATIKLIKPHESSLYRLRTLRYMDYFCVPRAEAPRVRSQIARESGTTGVEYTTSAFKYGTDKYLRVKRVS